MKTRKDAITAVPTNVITGFLGVGKTSAILHLLRHKPEHERWAVLVNEFGEIGVDGSLFAGRFQEESGVYIREVPGGCMCCAAGLPMQIALNQLLRRAKPDRLLIEPTGLGHPKEVMQVLSAAHYQEVLSLQKTLTLVDARKLSDARFSEHETFKQQVSMADTVVGNKLDLYQAEHQAQLFEYVAKYGQPNTQVIFARFGELEPEYLAGDTCVSMSGVDHHHSAEQKPMLSDAPIPECGYLKASNAGEGFESVGWRFSADTEFSRTCLLGLLSGIEAERMKAVFITTEGVFGYNLTPDALTEIELDDCLESCIEIIAPSVDDQLEARLLECISAP